MHIRLLLLVWFFPLGLSAQLDEDFSDGDFTQNPPWVGDTNFFQVNTDLELQTNGPPVAETLHLATAQSRVAGTEWRCYLRYPFGPSNANRMRFYLVSDQPDLEGPLAGYFIEVGENGSDDTYRLYRQDGETAVALITGVLGLAAAEVDATVRILRDQVGNWQLSVEVGQTGQFVGQGTAFDDTYTSSAWAGVWVQHSSTRGNAFFFDNVYAGDTIRDLTPPALTGLEILGPQSLRLDFSEPLAPGPAQLVSHYSLSGGIGTPAAANWVAAEPARVTLDLATPLVDGTTYTLTLTNLADTAGNVLPAPLDTTFLYDVPDLPAAGDVVFHELMADPTPSVGLPEVEYMELYNRSDKTLDLAGWTVTNGTVTSTLPAYTLAPGALLLLARAQDATLMSNYGPVLGLSTWPILVNSGDNMGLRSAEGLLIDTLDYTVDWYGSPAKADGGYSLEMIDPDNRACPPAANWTAAVAPNGGTPAAPNSVFNPNPPTQAPGLQSARLLAPTRLQLCFDQSMDPALLGQVDHYALTPATVAVTEAQPQGPDFTCVELTFGAALPSGQLFTLVVSDLAGCRGNALVRDSVIIARGEVPGPFDLIINELLADPTPPIGLPEAEFVEIYNRSDRILELDQLQFSDASSTVRLSARILPPGAFLILCAASDSAAFAAFGPVMGLPFLPTLNNGGDSLYLRGPFDEPIDAVFYTSNWYGDSDKAAGGWTLERIDPELVDCPITANWRAAIAPAGGTPGQPNSLLGTPLEVPPLRLEAWSLPDPAQIILRFNQPLAAGLAQALATYQTGPGLAVEAVTLLNAQAVRLNLNPSLDSAGAYRMWAPDLADCLGQNWEDTLDFGLTVRPGPFDLRIHELMIDPTPRVGLPEVEYAELHNPGSRWLDLSGLRFSRRGSGGAALGERVLPPGGFLVLATENNAPALADIVPAVVGLSGLPTLANSRDSLYLFDADDTVIDQVFYQDTWYRDASKVDGGWSLERIDPNLPACDHSGNWRASQDPSGGTPGRANSVAAPFAERQPPRLLRVAVPAEHVVSFTFDEPLDAEAVDDPTYYDLSGAPGFLLLAELAPGGRTLRLTFDAPFAEGQLYSLFFDDLPGCNGGLIREEVFVGLPQTAVAGDLRIHEILFNPYTGGSDFVEIINVSDKVLDLSTLRIGRVVPGTDSIFSDHPLSTEAVQMLPGQILCLTRDVAHQQRTYLTPGEARFLEMSGFPAYANSEGICVIFTQTGEVLDRLDYFENWHHPSLTDRKGVSLERLSVDRPTQDADNWRSAAQTVGFATPGYRNSQTVELGPGGPGLVLEPAIFSPDNDGIDDVLGIRYALDFPAGNARVLIFDTQGRLVHTLRENTLLGAGEGVFFWDGRDNKQTMASLGAYVVVLEVTRMDTGERRAYRAVATLAQRF